MIYGSETWKPTKPMENKLRSARKGMEKDIFFFNKSQRQEKSFFDKREQKSQGPIGSNQGTKVEMGRSYSKKRGQQMEQKTD